MCGVMTKVTKDRRIGGVNVCMFVRVYRVLCVCVCGRDSKCVWLGYRCVCVYVEDS